MYLKELCEIFPSSKSFCRILKENGSLVSEGEWQSIEQCFQCACRETVETMDGITSSHRVPVEC